MTDVPDRQAIPRPGGLCRGPVHDGPGSCDTPHPAIPRQVVCRPHSDLRYQPYPGAPAPGLVLGDGEMEAG